MHRLWVLCLIPGLILVAACGPSLYVGYARPGYVVRVREKSGKVLSRVNYDGVIDGMYGFCRAPDKSIYVASYRTGSILRYRNWRFKGVVAKGLAGPTALVALPDGDLLVACTGSTQYLLDEKFEGRGSLQRVGMDGSIETFVESELIGIPTALVTAEDGTIYVGGRGSGRILRLVDGRAPEIYADLGDTLPGGPMHLAIAPDGSLYAASPFASKIICVEPRRTVVDDEELGKPGGLAFGKDGALYVTSFDRGELRAYDPETGHLIRIVARELAAPWSIEPR